MAEENDSNNLEYASRPYAGDESVPDVESMQDTELDACLEDLLMPEHLLALQDRLIKLLGPDFTLKQLHQMSDSELFNLRGIGRKKVHQIRAYLAERPELIRWEEALEEQGPEEDELQLDPVFSGARFGDIPIPEDFRIAQNAIIQNMSSEITIAEVLRIDKDILDGFRGVGSNKIQQVLELKEYLITNCDSIQQTIEKQNNNYGLNPELLSYRLENLQVSSEHRLLKDILIRSYGDDVEVKDLICLTQADLISIQSIGKHKARRILEFIDLIRSGELLALDDIEESAKGNDNDIDAEDFDTTLDLHTLEPQLIEAMDDFIARLDEKRRYIFCSRHGIDCEALTLEQIGESFPGGAVTRERIRQLQKKVDIDWPFAMGIRPRRLRFSVMEHLSLLRHRVLEHWQSRFHSEQNFYDFLALSCDIDQSQLREIVNPTYSNSLLQPLWVMEPSPLPLDDVLQFIIEETGHELATAENIIYRLHEAGRIALNGDQVSPRLLTKPEAVAHVLTGMPEGASWEEIHKAANLSEVCRTEFPTERLDGGVGFAVDQEWIYQIGRGEYRHTKYLQSDPNRARGVLEDIKAFLEDARKRGRTAISLMVDFYEGKNIPEDYFTVRHWVKTQGEQYGIFFRGKSGTDTLSLEDDFSLVSQSKAIVANIAARNEPVTVKQIAKLIRSKSTGHAKFYLDQLIEQHKLVRVSETAYDTPEKAFSHLDVEKAVRIAASIIENDERVIDAGLLTKRLNRRMGLRLNKFKVISLLQIYAEHYGFNWHFGTSLVSKNPLPARSVSALVRLYKNKGYYETDNLINQLESVILVDPARVLTAIINVNNADKRCREQTDEISPLNDEGADNVNFISQPDDDQGNYLNSPVSKQAIKKAINECRSALTHRIEKLLTPSEDSQSSPFDRHDSSVSETQRTLKHLSSNQLYLEREASRWMLRIFCLRYMEINDLLGHGFSIFPEFDPTSPAQVLADAVDIATELGMNRDAIADLKLSNDGDEELYRQIFIAQCCCLHEHMPFIFPPAQDPTYSILPENLLRTDSFLKYLIQDVEEKHWKDLGVFHELYACLTQMCSFEQNNLPAEENSPGINVTSNIPQWFARCMVQNSFALIPELRGCSAVGGDNIEAVIPIEGSTSSTESDCSFTDPEKITFCDPCTGSGIFLLEGYRILYAVYLANGYRKRDIPVQILSKNLFGVSSSWLDSAFASVTLILAARHDDRRLFRRKYHLNIHPVWDRTSVDDADMSLHENHALNNWYRANYTKGIWAEPFLGAEADSAEGIDREPVGSKNSFAQNFAAMSTKRFSLIVSAGDLWNAPVAAQQSNVSSLDLFKRVQYKVKESGVVTFLGQENWMFDPATEGLREFLYTEDLLRAVVHVDSGAIPKAGRMAIPMIQRGHHARGSGDADDGTSFLYIGRSAWDRKTEQPLDWGQITSSAVKLDPEVSFSHLPYKRMAYWVPRYISDIFASAGYKYLHLGAGRHSVDSNKHVRLWHELDFSNTFAGGHRSHQWNLYASGNDFKPWAGNLNWVSHVRAGIPRLEHEICWLSLSSGPSAAFLPEPTAYSSASGSFLQGDRSNAMTAAVVINSSVFKDIAAVYDRYESKRSITKKQIQMLPVANINSEDVSASVGELVSIVEQERKWNEENWDFEQLQWIKCGNGSLESRFSEWEKNHNQLMVRLNELQSDLDAQVAAGYGVEAAPYRGLDQSGPYPLAISDLKSEQCARLVSFAIGCMMGRFSLGKSGEVLADGGTMAEVQSRIEDGTYAGFYPDEDGIIPLNHREWFEDDATKRFLDFLEVLGGEFYLEENINFVAEGLSPCLSNPVEGESSHRIIRRYINQEFYPQHLQYYSKRPIYWLLSSGKHRAFECLLYMHRYTEGTLARIRIAYISPLIEKYRLHIEQLPSRIENASTMSQNMELQEELKLFESMQRELHHFDDKLNFYANKRIHIDLNDGVKYNHAKFEDLLAGLR